jgi:broad specificity phosphatase PhoE
MQLTLVRHGVTRWNAERRFQGTTDLPLSEEGRAQAAALARRLAHERPDRIYSSRLKRARETAEAIARMHRLSVSTDARLREFAFGAWEGLTWLEIVARYPNVEPAGWRNARAYSPEGGETFDAVCERSASFVEQLIRDGSEHAVIVTHAGVLHALLHVLHLADAPPAIGANFLPASITRIALDNQRPRLILLSDVTHLAGAKGAPAGAP